ncbi:MAG: DUF1573 domain-containing protein [Cytophagaceae bacterium]
MKKILFSLILALGAFALKAQTSEGPKSGPIITFTESAHDFGDIIQGDSVTHVFKFKNSGSTPLIISEVITTCGCTAPTWTKDPVMPGKSGEILITYRSAGKQGLQNKIITILSNATNTPVRASIRVNVLPKK